MTVDCVFAWMCIILAFHSGEPMWAVASALFALAAYVSDITHGGDSDG